MSNQLPDVDKLPPKDRFPYVGHDQGEVVYGPDQGFATRPMTPAELAAREPALAIAKDIYRHACYAGVCYAELWEIIAKAIQGATEGLQRDLHNAQVMLRTQATIKGTLAHAMATAESGDTVMLNYRPPHEREPPHCPSCDCPTGPSETTGEGGT